MPASPPTVKHQVTRYEYPFTDTPTKKVASQAVGDE
jgi:hypothetical protein